MTSRLDVANSNGSSAAPVASPAVRDWRDQQFVEPDEHAAFCRFAAGIYDAYEYALGSGHLDLAEALGPVLTNPVRAFWRAVSTRSDPFWCRLDFILEEIESKLTVAERRALAQGNRLEPGSQADRWEIRDMIVDACAGAQDMAPITEDVAEVPSLVSVLDHGRKLREELSAGSRVTRLPCVGLRRARSSVPGGRRRPSTRRSARATRADPGDDGSSDPDPSRPAGKHRLTHTSAPAAPGPTKPVAAPPVAKRPRPTGWQERRWLA
jgi:hypothetical protein